MARDRAGDSTGRRAVPVRSATVAPPPMSPSPAGARTDGRARDDAVDDGGGHREAVDADRPRRRAAHAASREAVASLTGFPSPAGWIDLQVAHGEVVRLVGPNGSGKTSLLRCLAGLPAPIEARHPGPLADADAGRLSRSVAMVHQDARDSLVGLTVAGEFRFRGLPPPTEGADQDVATLSSGEARRTALAVADREVPLLLLDEPVEGLDAEGLRRLERAIVAGARRGGVVFVDHGRRLAHMAHRTVSLGHRSDEDPPPLPRPGGDVRLRAPAMDTPGSPAPAVALAPGLHVVVGPNGCGKSTWLRRLAGLQGGEVRIDGAPALPGGNVRLLLPHGRDHLQGERVGDLLGDAEPDIVAGLVPAGLMGRHPLALSGGEAQRVALAMTLGRPAAVVLLDEPDAHLDGQGRQALFTAIARRIETGSVVLAASHDPSVQAAGEVIRWP